MKDAVENFVCNVTGNVIQRKVEYFYLWIKNSYTVFDTQLVTNIGPRSSEYREIMPLLTDHA